MPGYLESIPNDVTHPTEADSHDTPCYLELTPNDDIKPIEANSYDNPVYLELIPHDSTHPTEADSYGNAASTSDASYSQGNEYTLRTSQQHSRTDGHDNSPTLKWQKSVLAYPRKKQ